MKKLLAILCGISIMLSSICVYAIDEEKVSIDIETEHSGNIFFSNEDAEFIVTLANNTENDLNINAKFDIYSYNEDFDKSLEESSQRDIILKADSERQIEIEYDAKQYGLYYIEVSVSGQASAVYGEDFSKVIKNTVLNHTFGCASQMYGTTLGGNPEIGMPLMANAGIGVIREAPHWTDYEKIKGNYALSDAMKKSCELSYKYGIDRIMTILCRNPEVDSSQKNISNYILSEESFDELQEYVTRYLSEPSVKKAVNMVEVENEPKSFSYLDGVDLNKNPDRYELLGDRYAKIAIAVAKGAKAAGNFPVGFLSIADVEQESTKTFVKSAFDTILEQGSKNLFTAITMHPYIRNGNTEKDIVSNISYYDGLMKRYGLNYNKKWHTEYGFSTYNTSEWAIAAKIIREYARLKEYNFKDVYCVYQLIDNIDTKSTDPTQKHYGLLNSYKDVNVPYGAKYGYLATAAINKLTENSVSCDKVYNEDGSYICKFKSTVRDVYMMWNENEESKVSGFPVIEDAVYYDMLGNEIPSDDVLDVNNKYILNGTPIYAVVGEAIGSEIDDKKLTVKVSGNIESGQKDKMVSFAVINPEYENKTDLASGIISMNQGVTGENGFFEFETNIYDCDGTVNAYIVSEDSREPLIFRFTNKKDTSYELKLKSGIIKLNAFDLNLLDEENSYIELDFANVDVNEESQVIYALYNKGKLIDTHICKNTFLQENGTKKYPLEINASKQYDEISIFLWNNELVPLCKAVNVKN